MTALVITLLVIDLVLLALLVIRDLGERAYPVRPEYCSPSAIQHTTCLHEVLESLLSAAKVDNVSLATLQAKQLNIVYPLDDADVAMLTRIQLADQAETCLDVQYYLFHDDEAGHAMLAALIEAAQRGVQVRLLLDDMDTWRRERFFIRLMADYPTIQIRVFNPFWLRWFRLPEYIARFPRVTRRMHNKSFSADVASSIVGGRNIGNEYFNLDEELAFADLDVLIAGPTVSKIVQAFTTYWFSGLAVNIQRLGKVAKEADYQVWRQQLRDALARYRIRMQQKQVRLERWQSLGYLRLHEGPLRLLYDSPYKVVAQFSETAGNMVPDLLDLMEATQRELVIASPYFVPTENGLQAFRALRERGVKIMIITNSYAATDVPLVHSGYVNYRKRLLAMGVELFEVISRQERPKRFRFERLKQLKQRLKRRARREPKAKIPKKRHAWSLIGSKRASLHAKAFIVDQRKVFVGSFNLDPRSMVHNTEMGVVFDNPDYAEATVQDMRFYVNQHAYRVQLNPEGQLQWQYYQAGERHISQQEPDMTRWQRLLVKAVAKLPVEWLL